MAAETYELLISGTLAGQFVQSVFHINVNNVGDEHPYEEAGDILNTLSATTNFFNVWTGVLPTIYTITSARCKKILATGGPTNILLGVELSDSVGQRSGHISSAQLNPVLVWITDPRPDKPGRTFLPGISETDIDEMVYTGPWIAAAGNLISNITQPFTLDGSSDPANFSVYRRALNAADSIDFGRISPVIGTQRRRLHPV